jgi:fatty acid elongase 3
MQSKRHIVQDSQSAASSRAKALRCSSLALLQPNTFFYMVQEEYYSVARALRSVLASGTLDGARDFRFRYGESALSVWYVPILTCVLYYVFQRGIQQYMKERTAPKLKQLLFVYNMTMSFGSAALFAALTKLLWSRWQSLSLHDMICSKQMHEDGRVQLLYWMNYFFKYIELADTLFLAIRKRKIIFLHSYHHAATLVLCWSQLVEHSAVQWVVIDLNLFVHIIMYYYYAVSALGIKPWWRRYLTKLQISQFVIDLTACGYAYGYYVVYGWGSCYGTVTGAYMGIGILFSYLLLFIKFYIETYKGSKSATKLKV